MPGTLMSSGDSAESKIFWWREANKDMAGGDMDGNPFTEGDTVAQSHPRT